MHMPLRQARCLAGAIAASAALSLGALREHRERRRHAWSRRGQARILRDPARAAAVGPLGRAHREAHLLFAASGPARRARCISLPRPPATPSSPDTSTRTSTRNGSAVTFYEPTPCPPKSTTGWRLPDTRPSSLDPTQTWGISSWQAFNGCWATTLYYGLDFGGTKYQYPQGDWEAAQIGAPWDNHVLVDLDRLRALTAERSSSPLAAPGASGTGAAVYADAPEPGPVPPEVSRERVMLITQATTSSWLEDGVRPVGDRDRDQAPQKPFQAWIRRSLGSPPGPPQQCLVLGVLALRAGQVHTRQPAR